MTIAILVLTGCSKDNNTDNNNSTNGKIIGKWEAVTEYELINGVWEEWFTYESGERVFDFKNNGKVINYEEGVKTMEVNYSYNPQTKELILMGFVCLVDKLTSTELEIITFELDENLYEFKTAYKRIN